MILDGIQADAGNAGFGAAPSKTGDSMESARLNGEPGFGWPDSVASGSIAPLLLPDSLSRNVYCILGIPVDAIEMTAVIAMIETAVVLKVPFLISTPNTNFLVGSQTDREFHDSLLASDLCPADGMSIIGIARLTGVPIRQRVAGSDIFEVLKRARAAAKPLRVFLFGGLEGAGEAACEALNAVPSGVQCIGMLCPGFGTVEEMSARAIIDTVNDSEADFLTVSLGAKKGQIWLLRNHDSLHIPVRAHLGAVINFEAGTVRRAPSFLRASGFEWLWRIKEEPHLWRRYWNDGWALLHLLAACVLPLAIEARRLRRAEPHLGDLTLTSDFRNEAIVLTVEGAAIAKHAGMAVDVLRKMLAVKMPIVLDLSKTTALDARFLGLFLMLRKDLMANGQSLAFAGVPPRLAKIFRLNNLSFLLKP